MSDMRISTTPPTGDISNLDGTLGPEPGAQAKVHLNHNGGVETNFGAPFSKMEPSGQAPILNAVKGIAEKFEELSTMKADADGKGMTNTSDAIQKQMDKLLGMLDDLKKAAESLDKGMTPGMTRESYVKMIGNRAEAMLDSFVKQLDKSGFADRIGGTASTSAPEQSSNNSNIKEMEGGVGGSNVAPEDGTSELGNRYIGMSDEQMLTHFSNNPESAWKEIASLPPGERGVVMQKLQMAVQADNQLQSMLTNFMKAMHDTAKGTISNLRV